MRRRRDPLATDLDGLIERVLAYVAYRVGDGPAAEDITGEVFERAVRYRDRFDPERGEPVAWLIGIARSRIAEAHSQPEAKALGEDLPGAQFADAAVDRLAVRAAIKLLSHRDRELIALRYGADLSSSQIGELLGMSPNAVNVALHRALDRVRRSFADETPGASAGPA